MLYMRSHLDARTAEEGPQRQHFNSASLAGTNSAAHRGDSLEVTAQDQCSSVTVCKQQKSSPLLFALLKGNPSDSKSYTTQSCPSKGSNGQIKPGPNVSGERNCKGQQVTGSLVARNCGQTRTHLDHSGETPPSPHQQQVYSPPLNSQPSTDKVLAVGTMEPPTDAEIHDFIAKMLSCFKTILTPKNREWDRESTCIKPKVDDVAHLPTTSEERDVERGRLNCAGIEGCTAAVGQALERDNSKGSKANAELTATLKESDDCPTSESEKHSTGILFSAEEHSNQACKNKSIEKSAAVDFDLALKKHVDVTRPANSDRKLVYLDDCGDKTFVGSNDKSFHSKWCNKYIQNGMATVHYSLTALKELISSLEKVETIAETENISKVILQRYWNGNMDNVHLFVSTEYPQIMMRVAAACTKNEDNSPGVLTAVPGMTWDAPTEKQPRLMLNHSSPWLNTNKDLDETDHVPVVSWAPNHMTEREKALKKAEGLHCVQGMTDVSEDLQTNTSSAVSENKRHATLIENRDAGWKNYFSETHSKLHSSVGKIQIHNVISIPINQSEWLSSQTSSEGEREEVASVHSQKASSMAFPENKLKKHTHPLYESEVGEARPIYEDISDEEVLQLATEPPNRKRRGIGSPTPLEAIQYEDISDAESQNGSIADETSPLAQGPEPNNKQSPFEIGGYGCVQSLKTEIISFDKLTGLEDVLSPKCNCERRTNQSVSCANDEYETDDEMDDDYLVIPISLLGIQFEPEDKDQDSPETNVPEVGETGVLESQRDTSPTSCCSPPKLAAAFPLVPVYDTQECFLQAVQCENVFEVALGMSTPEHEVDSEVEAQTPQNSRGSVESCETENSCDYSSASESNYLTASRKMLKKRSACLPSETDVSSTEEDSEGNEVTDIQRGQTRSEDKLHCVQKPGRLLEPKVGCCKHIQLETIRPSEISKRDDIVIIDSDTEDESDQKCKKRKRKTRKRLYSSDLEDSGDASCSHQKRHFPESVEEKFQSNELSSAVSPAPQHQSKHGALFKEGKQDACSDQSHDAEKSGQLIQTKVTSEQPTTNRPKTSEREAVIIINSNSEDDDDDPNYKTQSRKRSFSSGSDDDDASCVDPESDDGDHRTAKEKLQVLQNADAKEMLSSGSEQSGDDLFAAKNRSTETENSLCGTANAKPQQNRISSEDSPGKRSQSVDNEAISTWGPNPVIPRFVVESSQPSDSLILLKEPGVHRQGNDMIRSPKTSTASSKKKDSCEKNKAHLLALIIINSNSEDDDDDDDPNYKTQSRKRSFSSGSDDGDASCVDPESDDGDHGTAKEKLQGTELSSRDLSLLPHQSKGNGTPLREVVQDECSDLSQSVKKSGQLIETTGGSDHVQHGANRQTMSKRKGFLQDSDKVVKKGYVHQMANAKGMLLSGSEQSGDDLFAAKNRSTENSLWGTANAKPQQNRISSEDSPGKRSQSVDNEANSTWGPNPVIPHFVVVKPFQPSDLILLKEPGVHRQGNDKTRSPKTSTASSKKDSCVRSKAHLHPNKKVRFLLSPKPTNETPHATKNNLKANVAKPTMFSRKRSLPSQEGPPTTSGSLPSTSGQLSESRQSSASSKRLSPSGESSASTSLPSSTPRQHLSSSKLQRSHSYDNPSPLTHPPTKCPASSATMQSPLSTRLRENWKNTFVPTRRDRKTSQEDSRATNESYREARPGPGPGHRDRAPRQRHNSHEPVTRLMKKTMDDAKQWTKAINRNAPKEKRNSVGEGYKWSEKSTKGSSRKGKRCRSPPIIFESD